MVCLLVSPMGCSEPEFDTSSPDAAIDAMTQMVEQGRPDLLVRVVHISARAIEYDDGVTEASAIDDVLQKTGDLLAQLHRVSRKLDERFPGQIANEADTVTREFGFLLGGSFEQGLGTFLKDPFAFIRDSREHISTIDLGDGTAAILWDGEPPFGGIGLSMVETSDGWKIDVPIDNPMLSRYRPNTREEWHVVANLMLGFENKLKEFEDKLDSGAFNSIGAASAYAGRLLGEAAVVQALIYSTMKDRENQSENNDDTSGT